MDVATQIGTVLAGLGADVVFGVVGSGNFHVTNALVAAGARFVPSAHEAGSATAADSYARLTGKVGIVSVHQGPGVTNALTGLDRGGEEPYSAYCSGAGGDEPEVEFLPRPGGASAVDRRCVLPRAGGVGAG